MKHVGILAPALAATVMILGCGDGTPTEPGLTRAEVAATYGLTILTFDPQGSLPEIDLRDRLSVTNPTLQLTGTGIAQLTFRDPDTNLLVTVDGTFTTTATGVRVDFGDNTEQGRLLLSRTMTFAFQSTQTTTLSFEGDPGTISRARLLELAPELEGEQLLDPVPGTLEIVFQA